MRNFSVFIREKLRRSFQRERFLEKPVEAFSRFIWPYPVGKLVLLVGLMPVLDCISTFAMLELSGKDIREAGLIGKWALSALGFPGLFVIETACVSILILIAIGLQTMYSRLGFNGFGRAACVLVLAPTFVAVLAAVLNNVILTLL